MNVVKQHTLKVIAAIALLCVFSMPAMAQQMKIGVVNVPVLMEQAPQAKLAMDALTEEFAPRQREILARNKEYEELGAKFQKDGPVMGETERRNAENDLRNLQREVTRLQNEFREDLNLRRNEELGNLQRVLLQEVQNYAQTAGFDLIVGEGVLYASQSVNITENVLRAMEANFQANGN